MRLRTKCLRIFGGVVAVSGVLFVFGSAKTYALNTSFYIDCSAPTNGTGTIGSPWNTPQSLFNHQFAPTNYAFGGGDRVLLRSGTTCTYPVRMLRGSGVPGNPVVITAYGTGARPIINGSLVQVDNWDGQADSSAVQLRDFDNVTVEGLELMNTGGAETAGRRQGVWSLATEKYGVRQNITIRDNYIHDIWGEYMKNREATAAINIEQRIPPTGVDPTPDPTWYDNILIEDNILERSHHQGISLWGDWRNRVEEGSDVLGPAWTAWTDVTIQDNTIRDMRGDGILLSNTEGAVVQRNTVTGFNQLNSLPEATIVAILNDAQAKQGLPTQPSRNHAGMFSYNTNNSLFQYNDVRGGISNRDGMAYDIDGGSIGTIFQYNYSQDNEGGFANICGEVGQIRDGKIRYNVSKNDGFATFTTCVGTVLNTQVYNNTIYSTNPLLTYPYYEVDWLRFGGDPMNDTKQIDLRNNIFVYPEDSFTHFFNNFREGSGVIQGQGNAAVTAHNNIYYGVTAPARESNPSTTRPIFKDVTAEKAGFELYSVSAGVNSGVAIASNGGVDILGASLSAPYNIGAIESTLSDADGLNDTVENTGPNGGDGNGDGIADIAQPHVGSAVSTVTGAYMTLQTFDTGQTTGTPSDCTTLNSLSAKPMSKINASDPNAYPVGMVYFELTCATAGDSADITLFLDKVYDTSKWVVGKYGTSFKQISGVVLGTRSVGGTNVTTISYSVTGGGSLDQDGAANGTIVDPVGPAVLAATSQVTTLANTGQNTVITALIAVCIIGGALKLAKSRRVYYYRRKM